MARQRVKKHPSSRHCKCFDGTTLVGMARAGLGAVAPEHAIKVVGDEAIGCSVNLDASFKESLPADPRWDYILVLKDDDGNAIGMEDHHASPTEIDAMIAKKEWASELMGTQCPKVHVGLWCWIASSEENLVTPNTPAAHRLAEAGIVGPWHRLVLR